MGSPAGCGFDFRQSHLNMIERIQRVALLPENTAEMLAWRTSGINVWPLLRRTSNAMGLQQRHDLRDYKEAKSAFCASVASVGRSIPVQRRMEKNL